MAHGSRPTAQYTVRDVAKLLDLSPGRVRSYVRAGLVPAERGPRGEYRFTFQALVLLRAAKGLVEGRVPRARIRAALRQLRDSLPRGRSLSELHIGAEGHEVVVHDGSRRWSPESGQLHFDFDVGELARKAAPLARVAAERVRDEEGLTAKDWYATALELEAPAPAEARRAYEKALELNPELGPAHVNLGRLLHVDGDLAAAEEHYRAALAAVPDDGVALFNLGVLLEDRGRRADALAAYEDAIRADPQLADAHYNAATLCEELGRRADAVRHFQSYRRLTR